MSDPFFEWQNVDFSICQGFFMRPVKTIKNFSLKLRAGFSLGLVGPNGAGKTTTIKLGAGILTPDSGQVLLRGQSVQQAASRIRIGFLTENQYIYPHLKLKEWLVMLGQLSGMEPDHLHKQVDCLLERFDLVRKSDALLNTLSKGQIQRAGFIQAFLHEPEILLLDEPMSGLDPLWRSRIQDFLLAYKKNGGTLVFSSHIMSDVERLSDQIVIIRSGQIQWEGGIHELSGTEDHFQAAFYTRKWDMLKKKFNGCTVEKQPNGSYVVQLDAKGKKILLALAGQGTVNLVSLTPVYPDFKELFS